MSVMKYLSRDKLASLGIGIIFPALAVVISYLLAFAAVKIFRIRKGRRGIFINAVANANTIFIGMPLNNALFGSKAMSYFLIYYIVNTVSTWAFGVFLIQNDDPTSDGKSEKREFNWRKLLPMPLVGFVFSIIWSLLGIPVPNFLGQTLSYIGSLVTPLSLIYIGIVLYDAGLNNFHFERDSVLALIGRFIISPLVLILLIKFGTNSLGISLPSLMQQTLVVQSATPMLAVLPILGAEAHGDVKFATDVVVMSTVLFVVVVPILMSILQFV